MLPLLHDFVDATKDMQHRDTPSGGYRTGGLGEGRYHIYIWVKALLIHSAVKFEVDRRPFTGNLRRSITLVVLKVLQATGVDHNTMDLRCVHQS